MSCQRGVALVDYIPIDSEEHVLVNSDEVTVSVTTNGNPDLTFPLWAMVQSGFRELNRRSFEKQDMTAPEFGHDFRSHRVLKYLAKRDGHLVGYLTVHVGLDEVTWIDTAPLIDIQASLDSRAAPYYIGTLVVPQELRGGGVVIPLLRAALQHFQAVSHRIDCNSLCFFDCAGANHPGLVIAIRRSARPTARFAGIPITVREISKWYWVKAPQGDTAYKTPAMADGVGQGVSVIDAQYIYSIELAKVTRS